MKSILNKSKVINLKLSFLFLVILFAFKNNSLKAQLLTMQVDEGSRFFVVGGFKNTNFACIPGLTWGVDSPIPSGVTAILTVDGVNHPISIAKSLAVLYSGNVAFQLPSTLILTASNVISFSYTNTTYTCTPSPPYTTSVTSAFTGTSNPRPVNFTLAPSSLSCTVSSTLTPSFNEWYQAYQSTYPVSSLPGPPINVFKLTKDGIPVTASDYTTTSGALSCTSGTLTSLTTDATEIKSVTNKAMPTNLKLKVLLDRYTTLTLGYVTIVFASYYEGSTAYVYRYADALNGISESPIPSAPFTGNVGDEMEINSLYDRYELKVNGVLFKTIYKNITLTTLPLGTSGSLSTYTLHPNDNTVWSLPTSPGTYSIIAEMGNLKYLNIFTVTPVPLITGPTATAICSGNALNYNITSSTPSSYNWISNNNVNTNGESLTLQTTSTINNNLTNLTLSPQNLVYTITPTSSFGCIGNPFSFSVTVNPTPTINITGTNVLCNGSSTSLLANGGSSYLWNTTSTLNPLIVSPSSTTSYTVTGTDANGCVNSKSISVTVNPLPNVNFAFNNDSLCVGGCVTFTNNSNVIGDVITSYNWNFGDGGTSSVIDPTYCFPNSGTYTVSLSATTNNSCTATFMNTASPITISSFANANFDFSPTSPIDLGSVVNFLNSSTNSSSFYWEFGDGSNSNMIDPSHSYDNIGTYAVSLIAYNGKGCNDTLIKSLDIKNPIFIPEIFTPNGDGMNDFFVIKGIESFPNNTLKIFNRWGNIVFEKDSYKNDWDGKTLLNGKLGAERLPASTYFVIFNFGDNKTKEYSGIVQLAY